MLLIAFITFITLYYLILFKKVQVQHSIMLIGVISLLIQIATSFQNVKRYIIYIIIIYLISIFIKLGLKFIFNIFKSIDHRRKFVTCFSYIVLYIISILLIVQTTNFTFLNWGYFCIFFILDYYYFRFINWPNKTPKSKLSTNDEWEESITFAIIAATLIHIFFIQPFTIPTSSMEKSMLVGDFLLVSKIHYGANIPNTPLAFPFMHQKIPGTDSTPSYSKLIQLGYNRLPGFQKITNNDIVVFNFPADSLQLKMPFDKKMNYVKRCVGIAGDSIEIIDKEIFINNKQIANSERIETQFNYIIKPTGKSARYSFKKLAQELIEDDIETYTEYNFIQNGRLLGSQYLKNGNREKRKWEKKGYRLKYTGNFAVFLTEKEKIKLEKRINKWFSFNEEITPKNLFPKSLNKDWTIDNYGPIYIPKKNDTLQIDSNSIHFYKQIIKEYENNNLLIKENEFYINGEKTNEYIVKMNYYWMMGDNRHNSEDSRIWGFVPENHIVGKPIFTWLSLNYNALNKRGIQSKLELIRWKKLFTTIHGDGLPRSYFIHFLVFLLLVNLAPRLLKKKQ